MKKDNQKELIYQENEIKNNKQKLKCSTKSAEEKAEINRKRQETRIEKMKYNERSVDETNEINKNSHKSRLMKILNYLILNWVLA